MKINAIVGNPPYQEVVAQRKLQMGKKLVLVYSNTFKQ